MTEPVIIGNATLYLGDCLEILPTLPKVNAVITDPPYSQRTHSGHDASASGHIGIAHDGSKRLELGYGYLSKSDVRRLSELYSSVCNGWIVWMTDHVLAPYIQDEMELRGRYVFAPLPFYAPGSRVRLSGDGPSSWTIWIIVSRTAKQSRWGTLPGGYVSGAGWNSDKQRMGGKPTALMDRLVSDYSRSNDICLDSHMGAGTTGISCIKLGRKFIGIEKEPKYFDIACRRIEQAYAQPDLFIDAKPQARVEQVSLFDAA